jgi:hypothetical protein
MKFLKIYSITNISSQISVNFYADCVMSLDLTTHTSLSLIRSVFAHGFVYYKKGALDSQPILLKVALKTPTNQIES